MKKIDKRAKPGPGAGRPRSTRNALCASLLLVVALTASSCRREIRQLRIEPPTANRPAAVRLSEIQPGSPNAKYIPIHNAYEENAYAISEGKRLFDWYNCSGCHAHGGGGIGPPLMDDLWIYGSAPEQIHSTILEGRPNGMPSFAGKIPEYQVWEIVAYVRSLSGLVGKAAAPGRNDDMQYKRGENAMTKKEPVHVGHE